MKKIYLILIAAAILIISGYLYIRYKVLKTKDFIPDASKSVSVLDLRPAIIAKLQQLVKDGSGGLYNLSIGELDPDVILSTIKVKNATLIPDSVVLLNLDKARNAPDDIFKISFSSLNIDGIGIEDLLHKDEIDLKKIYFSDPVIEIYHTKRGYNKAEREKNDSLTLYQRLMQGMKKISIDTILLEHATIINHNTAKKNNANRFNDVTVKFSNVLIDSTTQYNRDGFLFAKDADISFKDYALATPDSLYYFKVAAINVSAVRHTLTASHVSLIPRGNRERFIKKLPHMKDMFSLKVPKLTLNDIDWYSILNEDKIIIQEGTIEDCDFSDYFDRSVPASKNVSLNSFPHQLLMRMALPVYIQKINLQNCSVKYEEFNPDTKASGTIYFDNMNGQLSNITNMPEYIRLNSKMKLSATALFLGTVNFKTLFTLDLKNYKKGNFTVDVTAGGIDKTLVNPVAEPLGLISIKKGEVKKVVAHVVGTNAGGTGKVLLLYDDLHLVPLKEDGEGGIKKRSVTGFLANLLMIKNANPARGKEQREEDCDYKRGTDGSFFNLIWKTILTGVLKTIGIPVKFAYK